MLGHCRSSVLPVGCSCSSRSVHASHQPSKECCPKKKCLPSQVAVVEECCELSPQSTTVAMHPKHQPEEIANQPEPVNIYRCENVTCSPILSLPDLLEHHCHHLLAAHYHVVQSAPTAHKGLPRSHPKLSGTEPPSSHHLRHPTHQLLLLPYLQILQSTITAHSSQQ